MDLVGMDLEAAGQLCSPLSAARATWALKAALCLLRVFFMSGSLRLILGAGLSLSYLSNFGDHLKSLPAL